MNVPPAISALQQLTIHRRTYSVVGRPEATRNGLWRVPVVPLDRKEREPRVSFANLGSDGSFMGWAQIKRPRVAINTIHSLGGRDYRLVTDLELRPDGLWDGSLSPVEPLPGEKDRRVRFRSNGTIEGEEPDGQ